MALASIFEGNITLEIGSDVNQYGWGDLNVNRKIIINGTENSSGAVSSGVLLVNGGGIVNKSFYINENLNVLYGVTNLSETAIDTSNGPFSVSGVNIVDISVGGNVNLISTSGNTVVGSMSQRMSMIGGLDGTGAVTITATNTSGSVWIGSGVNGGISLVGGSSGIYGYTSSGNINLIANNANASLILNSNSSNQNISIGLVGNTDSQVLIESSGINTTRDAISIISTNTSGNISISNSAGIGSGKISINTGSNGLSVLTNTGGNISLVSRGAGSDYLVHTNSSFQDLRLELDGLTDSSFIIKSSGTVDAVKILSSSTAGNIIINQTAGSSGYVLIKTGQSGLHVETQTGGTISLNSYGASSLYTNSTTQDNQDLVISVSGNTDSRLVLDSSGTANDSILLSTSNSGGISLNGSGLIELQTSDLTNGIKIGTINNAPISLGTPYSSTTILGDLYVKGNTSTVNHQVVTVDDNILVLNNAPFTSSDGGVAVKRFQDANDVGTGDVVSDSPKVSGTVQSGSNTVSTIHMDSSSSSVNDYYSGWWIKILSGTGNDQVRKIKSYDGATKIATLFTSADQLVNLSQPAEGLDLLTVVDNTSTYGLYPCHYSMCLWDESQKEFALVCSSSNVSDKANPVFEPEIADYSDLHINNLQSNALFTSFINGTSADTVISVTLTDNSTTPVSLSSLSYNYGIYILMIYPESVYTRTHGIFAIGRVNSPITPGTFVRLISVKGSQDEQICLQWQADSFPEIYYRPAPGVPGTTNYKIKVLKCR